MSFDKIAKILHVDEVNLMHGPKGVAVHVRIDKSWHSCTIDNEALGPRRLEVITEHLIHLADGHIHKARGSEALRKAQLAAEQEEARAREQRRRFGLSWADVGGYDNPRDGYPQRQIQRVEPDVRPSDPLPSAPVEPAVSKSMPSRFHAIIEELKNL